MVLASAVILWSQSSRLVTIFYCHRFRSPATWRARSSYLCLQTPGPLFVASCDSQVCGRGVGTRLSAGYSLSLSPSNRNVLGGSYRSPCLTYSVVAWCYWHSWTCSVRLKSHPVTHRTRESRGRVRPSTLRPPPTTHNTSQLHGAFH
jgi:hypothetical protein